MDRDALWDVFGGLAFVMIMIITLFVYIVSTPPQGSGEADWDAETASRIGD